MLLQQTELVAGRTRQRRQRYFAASQSVSLTGANPVGAASCRDTATFILSLIHIPHSSQPGTHHAEHGSSHCANHLDIRSLTL